MEISKKKFMNHSLSVSDTSHISSNTKFQLILANLAPHLSVNLDPLSSRDEGAYKRFHLKETMDIC